METRNKAEAERLIREQHQMRVTPEDVETRRDTVGRSFKKKKSLIDQPPPELETQGEKGLYENRPYPASGTYSTDDDEGVHGTEKNEFGVEAYDNATPEVVEHVDQPIGPGSPVFTPNDDMAGQGWTPPTNNREGWQRPSEPAAEEQLEEHDLPDEPLPTNEP